MTIPLLSGAPSIYPLATVWLVLMLCLCGYAWFGVRRLWALPVLAFVAALAIYTPTGTPRYTAPPAGRYVVLGADIEVGVAIRVLLRPERGPAAYYAMPYSEQKAGELQNALDIGAQGGAVTMVEGEGGGQSYDGEPPVTGSEEKAAERPAVEVE